MNEEKYCVVTGGSSGIGKAIATGFAKKNWNLILVARKTEELEKTKQELQIINSKIDIQFYSVDLSNYEEIVKFYKEVSKKYNIKTWVNDAGMALMNLAIQDDVEKLHKMIELNAMSYAILTRLFVADHYKEEDATLFNVDSASGYTIFTPLVSYSATKYFVAAYTEGYKHELKLIGGKMRLKMLCPSLVKTNIQKNAGQKSEFDKFPGLVNTVEEIENYAMQLFDSDKLVGYINPTNLKFELKDVAYPYFNIDSFKKN